MNRKKYQQQRKNILIKGGVDIRKQVIGSEIGAYFSENFNPNHTIAVSPDVWKISFLNMKTGEIHRFQFSSRFFIGRMPIDDMRMPQLVLAKDGRVSKKHCMIYESQGYLCIQDLGSKNHTYINGRRIQQTSYINTGDILKVGNTTLKLEFGK